ncbi:MAG: hypothetical protein U5K29_00640 [Acidimicrobiales bacterium]|nr:hypothetical protein [Acidimicrobiales bacterium]
MSDHLTIPTTCHVTGLPIMVEPDGLLDEAVSLLLRRALDEAAAAAEDLHAYRLAPAARRYRRLADLLDRAEPDVARWVEARARALAERFEEVIE